ncbi:MAG: 5'/3'-nucleotidase SurE [Flavobacteriales bacterium]|nr:5'/3'-nucleotidase SurE [Flavobacteriales bacterium]|tara:strand:- start:637 stop:1404 length:768 start_codon:yes stop_codon:yes gene_type:complete
MKKGKPLILVVNDDGIDSQGINFLKKIMCQIGDVYVVAPDTNRSAYSHSMTLNNSISIKKMNKNVNDFACSGTPVDCVKLALNKILPRTPDLCVSGINHGSNQSINGLYSGTLHAAMEANIQGVPAISFSHLSYETIINFTPFSSFIYDVSKKVLGDSNEGVTFNINFPDVPFKDIKGVKVCLTGQGVWKEKFELVKKEKFEKHFLIGGEFKSNNNLINTDNWALTNNFISIVPVNLYPHLSINLDKLKYLENVF